MLVSFDLWCGLMFAGGMVGWLPGGAVFKQALKSCACLHVPVLAEMVG